MYSHAGPIKTELNDVPMSQSSGQSQYEGAGEQSLTHKDWCEDKTCHCQRD